MNTKPVRVISLVLLLASLVLANAEAKKLKVFAVGNSFAQDATRFLPEIAENRGHEVEVLIAYKGGCSLQQHSDALDAFLANPEDPAAKIYRGGKSLAELLGDEKWDVITLQQYSMRSTESASYQPYANKLFDYLKSKQPNAKIAVHQTWSYRRDADKFGRKSPDSFTLDQREMFEYSRAAYHQVAAELGVDVIPVGDAFWKVDSDPVWGYKTDTDTDTFEFPNIPDQVHSLHFGYKWGEDKTLKNDTHHANIAGRYLGALVWYAFLFGESPEAVTFVPEGIEPDFAAHLRQTASFATSFNTSETTRTAATFSLPLWDSLPPNHKASALTENIETERGVKVSQIQNPSLDALLPEKSIASGQAVIICPGGGYRYLSYQKEGTAIAERFAQNGIASFILKYRLPEADSNVDPKLSPLLDAQRALRLIRSKAAEWAIDPNKIGIVGFSAGGHLASTLATHYDLGSPESADAIERLSSRPDFAVLVYPVVSMENAITHRGSLHRLLGDSPSEADIAFYSNERHVTSDTPPTFLVHASNDKSVPVANSIRFYEALVKNDVPAELHTYPTGGHGFGLALHRGSLASWSELCLNWLAELN